MSMIAVDTLGFLSVLFAEVPRDQYLDVKLVDPGKTRIIALRSLQLGSPLLAYDLGQFLIRNWHSPSILLYGINPRGRSGGTRDVDVSLVICLVFDMDGKRVPLDEQKRRLGMVAELIPLSAVVESGTAGHMHAYFRLVPTVDVERTRLVGKRLRVWLGGDPTEFPCRPMRLPGCANWKSGQPVQARAFVEPNAITSIDALAAALDHLGVAAAVPRNRPQTTTPTSFDLADFVVPADQRIAALWEALSDKAKLLITKGFAPSAGYDSPSEADAAVMRMLHTAGATRDEARYFFLTTPNGIGAGYHRRGIYGVYFDRSWDFIESTTPEESTAVVRGVRPGRLGGQVRVELEVQAGPFAGTTLLQTISAESVAWGAVFLAAGLPPPPKGATELAGALEGACLRVRIDPRHEGTARRVAA